MSDIKVLALDLDGTLTNDQKLVTPRTRAALDAAIEKGVTIVLASGRFICEKTKCRPRQGTCRGLHFV